MEEYYLQQPPHVKPQCMGCGAPKRMWHDVCKYCEAPYNIYVRRPIVRPPGFMQPPPVQKKWVFVLQVIWDNFFIIAMGLTVLAGLITSIISQC